MLLPDPITCSAVPILSGMSNAMNNMPLVEPLGGSFDPSLDAGGESLSSSDSSDPVLSYISQILMEDQVCTFADNVALRDTEKSLYDSIGEQYPGSPNRPQNFDATKWIVPSITSNSSESSSERSSLGTNVTSTHSSNSRDHNGSADSSVLIKNTLHENDPIMQFKRGFEEASKFLPPSSQLVIDFENIGEDALSGSRGRKNREREDLGLIEGRAAKQTTSCTEEEESEISELLDKVLLCADKVEPEYSTGSYTPTDGSKDLQSSVDLSALLTQCAQAVSSNDLRTAKELLKQIRENSSPSGDGSQRLAHYFANGLEARMEGNHGYTKCFHASFFSNRTSSADMLRAYRLHISTSPFRRLSLFYMNYMIWRLSRKASVIHIIDFGLGLGFKWPLLIQKLGEQADGPPKLRITGIELPQPGFRPAERIEETGRHLARYCEQFNVPFEFNALPSSKWETIKIEDLKIRSSETIVVSCLMRFKTLLDESVEGDSPRDAVLNLIRRINPVVFVHSVWNGSYNAPLFVRRFREALFHWSYIFDMVDATITGEHKDSEERRFLESEIYGRMVMNVVACEGFERVERPETYKQWQVRVVRAGFKQLPLDQATMKMLMHKLEAWYHKDFVLDENENWMLEEWKGRIICATTCWVPR